MFFMVHDVRCDAEELGLAGAGIDEVGLVAGGDECESDEDVPNAMYS